MPRQLPTVRRVHDIPSAVVAVCPFPHDYVDAFAADVASAGRTSAEEWARATMEGAPAAGRALAWRVACRLRLAPDGTAGHIAGWRVAGAGDDWVAVTARSWFMTACMVFTAEPERVVFATLVRYDHPAARLIWGGVSAVHRAVAPGFLAGGVQRAGRDAARDTRPR